MANHQHIQIPFGADRDPIVHEWFAAQTAAIGLDFDKQLVYIAASDSRARAVRRGMQGAIPETIFGTIDGVVSRIAAQVDLPGQIASGIVAREQLRAAAMTVLVSTGEDQRPSRRWIDQIAGALKRVAVAFAPQDRAAELQRIELEAHNAGDTDLAIRLEFLREVGEEYAKRLAGAKLVDESDLEWLLIPRLDQALQKVQGIFIDDIYRVAPAQRALIEAIKKHERVALTILSLTSDPQAPREKATASAREWLTTLVPVTRSEEGESQIPTPHAFCGASQRQEAREITRLVKTAVAAGTPIAEIGIAAITHDQQKALMRELEFNGVPVRSHMEEALLKMPLVDGVLSLFRALAEGAERERLCSALRSPWLRGLESTVREELDKADNPMSWRSFVLRFSVLARKAKIVGGVPGVSIQDSWGKRISSLIEDIENPPSPERAKELEFANLSERDLAALRAGLALVEALAKVQAGPRQSLILGLYELIEGLELASNVVKVVAYAKIGEESQRRIHALSLNQFMETLRSFARVDADFGGNNQTALGKLLEDIEEEISSVFLRPRMGVDGVFLGGLLDARELSFKQLFIAGLSDGELPFASSENLYLPTRIREYAAHLSEPQREALAGESSPLELYRHLLGSAIAKERDQLCLSFPRVVEGGEVEPAVPLREILALHDFDTEAMVKQPLAVDSALGTADAQGVIAEQAAQGELGQGDFERPWVASALIGGAVNALRDDIDSWGSPFEGGLSGEARKLGERFKPEDDVAFISNSSLETYASCPLKYYFREVLGLEEEDRPDDEISPLDKGTLLHDTLEAFLLEVRRVINESTQGRYLDGSSIKAPDGADLAQLPLLNIPLYEKLSGKTARELLAETFAEKASRYPLPAASWTTWLERVHASLQEEGKARSELSEFLTFELAGQKRGVYPWLLEYSFGNKEDGSAPAYAVEDASGTPQMKIRGYIDRVDVLLDSEQNFSGFLVRDYKASRSSKKSELAAGTRFQLPVYAAAVEEEFAGLVNLGFFYHLLDIRVKNPVDAPTMEKDVLKALKGRASGKVLNLADYQAASMNERILGIDTAISSGLFHHAFVLGEKACEFCGFARMCARRSLKLMAQNQAPDRAIKAGAYAGVLGGNNDDE